MSNRYENTFSKNARKLHKGHDLAAEEHFFMHNCCSPYVNPHKDRCFLNFHLSRNTVKHDPVIKKRDSRIF